jgi:hypothetical protein
VKDKTRPAIIPTNLFDDGTPLSSCSKPLIQFV